MVTQTIEAEIEEVEEIEEDDVLNRRLESMVTFCMNLFLWGFFINLFLFILVYFIL